MNRGGEADERRIFKVAAGQANRDLRDVFVAKDFAAIGPGSYGDWSKASREERDSASKGDRRALDAMVKIGIGDLAALTVGQTIVTVGRVDKPYDFHEDWKKFAQWDLQNSIRVKWADPNRPEIQEAFRRADSCELRPRIFARGRLCWLQGGSEEAKRWVRRADRILDEAGLWKRDLDPPRLPFDDPRVSSLAEIPSFLDLPKGRQESIKKVFERADSVREGFDGHRSSSENGAVALMVTPFLEALGWGPELLAFELAFGRKRVDVAGFETAESSPPCFLVEAKRPWTGMDWARNQVKGYASRKNLSCPVFTTDGFYWALFATPDDPEPCGELLIPDVREGSEDFFKSLLEFGLVRP